MALVVVPIGVRKAVDALTATVIRKGLGESPSDVAASKAMGAINTAVAELLIVWLNILVNKNTPANNTVGPKVPMESTRASAAPCATPVFCKANPIGIMAAIITTLVQLIPL